MRLNFAWAGEARGCVAFPGSPPLRARGATRWTLTEAQSGGEIERARAQAEELRLVEAAACGSKEAFEALYRRHVGRVHGLCLRMTAHRETAEDCAQEAFVQAWRNLPRFQARSGFATWLHRIAVNAVLAQKRRRTESLGLEGSADDSVAETLADSTATDPGTGRDIEAAIASLPPGARYVLVLCGVYGYSHEEASGMLGIAVGTCKAQLHRARHLLAERMPREEQRR
jgi:RNA polymerase sigma-70 factor (ECF subfamily)